MSDSNTDIKKPVKQGRTRKSEVKRVPALAYTICVFLLAIITRLLFRLKVTKSEAFRRAGNGMIFIGNHNSYLDPIFLAVGAGFKHKLNFIATKDIFTNDIRGHFFRYLGTVPITQFVTSPRIARNIIELLRMGSNVAFYPERERRIMGEMHPIDLSNCKLFKKLGRPIAVGMTRGAYLGWPRWYNRIFSCGKVYIDMDILLTSEDLERMSADDIYDKLVKCFAVSDYEWQKQSPRPHRYRSRSTAVGLDKVLHYCCKCRSYAAMQAQKCQLTCRHCGLDIEVAASGLFSEEVCIDNHCLSSPADYYSLQSTYLARDFERPDFAMECVAVLSGNELEKYESGAALQRLAEGRVQLNKNSLSFASLDSDKTHDFSVDFAKLNGICFSFGVYVEIFYNKMLYRLSFREPHWPGLVRSVFDKNAEGRQDT